MWYTTRIFRYLGPVQADSRDFSVNTDVPIRFTALNANVNVVETQSIAII